MRTTIGNQYQRDPTYRTKLRKPAANVNIEELATCTNGLEALNRTNRLLKMYKTNRDEEPAHPESETHTDDVLSMITDDDQKEMMAQNRMLLKLLFEQQAKWKEERT